MKKVFLVTQFGKPHEWTEQYIENVQKLEKSGWYWQIFTPNNFKSKGNIQFVPMTIEQFADLVGLKCGIRPNLYITPAGIPNFHVTEFYVFIGKILEDYTKGFDFWGMTGMDNLYGRIDDFVSDKLLEECDVFSDDVDTLNGNFSLWRNNETINTLYKRLPYWKELLSQPDCPGCVTTGEPRLSIKHKLYSPEDLATEVLMKDIKFATPQHYDLHGHDNLENHELELKEDGSLWELNKDVRGMRTFGRQIAYYHFSGTKRWPL
jgi:hypothetical protein